MKKTLMIAALVAAGSLLAMPTYAADAMAAPAVEAKCVILPLLPACAAQWNDYWQSKGLHVKTPVAWWTCEKAAAGAGHLLECEAN
jgi:hypothetical protein